MIFLAYNFLRYKFSTDENFKYRDWVISTINYHFPEEDYLLPYSQYSRINLVKKLKCEDSLIKGVFFKDLPIIMRYCKKLACFPTEDNYIGSGMFIEMNAGKKFNLPVYCYNKDIKNFSQSFELKSTKLYGDRQLGNLFYKKVIFN